MAKKRGAKAVKRRKPAKKMKRAVKKQAARKAAARKSRIPAGLFTQADVDAAVAKALAARKDEPKVSVPSVAAPVTRTTPGR